MLVFDTFDRPLRSLRLSVTDRCNLRCQYCMPEAEYVWLPRKNILTFEETSALVDVFAAIGVNKLRLTGGEPLLRKNLTDLIRLLAAKSAIHDLALTTNGTLLADQVDALKEAGLHRITVSLDTLRADRFRALTRFDGVEAVQKGLAAAVAAGFDNLKIDTVVIRGVNDDETVDLLEYGRQLGAEVRFIEYMDVGGRDSLVAQRRRVTHGDVAGAQVALRHRDADRRKELGTSKALSPARRPGIRDHLVDHVPLLSGVRPESPHRRRSLVLVSVRWHWHRSAACPSQRRLRGRTTQAHYVNLDRT